MRLGTILAALAVVALPSCTDPIDESAELDLSSDRASAENRRIKDQVLEILCDSGQRDVQRELIPVVQYARQRDGKSDRVWEVADEADCTELEDSEQA